MISWNVLIYKNQNIPFPKIKSKFYKTAFNLFARLFICFLPVYLFVCFWERNALVVQSV